MMDQKRGKGKGEDIEDKKYTKENKNKIVGKKESLQHLLFPGCTHPSIGKAQYLLNFGDQTRQD